jgi:hypothetical protein
MKINIHKNYNNKLGQPFIVHIRTPAKAAIDTAKKTYDVTLTDGISESDYILHDYATCKASIIPAHLVWLSHNMPPEEFLIELHQREGVTPGDNAGVYFFRKKNQ